MAVNPKEGAAWEAQARTLVEVQKLGSNLETEVCRVLNWKGGRIKYCKGRDYLLQVDACHPNTAAPEVIVSVTYTDPDTRGHSNENKLHLKLGELALLKNAFPNCRVVLVFGGTEEAWLPYVLRVFHLFYDECIYLWQEDGWKRLQELSSAPHSITPKHLGLWSSLSKSWAVVTHTPEGETAPCGLLRYKVLDNLKSQPVVHHPSLITNEIARHCLNRSYESRGQEWETYKQRKWSNLEMARNFFNPSESAVELGLIKGGYKYQGGLNQDVPVPSFLHTLGMSRTRLSEDFVLFSDKHALPVYIQCKASGGGRKQHGKNIQNRTKEQIARSILYRAFLREDGELELGPQNYIWVSVLDGDWGVTTRQPLKYLHGLEKAGYSAMIVAESLVDSSCSALAEPNPLNALLESFDCAKVATPSLE